MKHPVAISEIVAGLAAQAPTLAAELLPGGRREGHEWRAGSLAGESGRSLAVHLSGVRAGVWADFASGEAGDALDLVAAVLFGGNKSDAVKWSLRWLGLDAAAGADLQERRRQLDAAARAREKTSKDDEAGRKRSALRVWFGARERLRDTPAELYLRGRGLDLAPLGRQPRVLRFHPALYNAESKREWPALVALIHGPDGKPAAVHRTWLEARPDGVAKAPLEDAKMTFGRYRGGCIHLWRGVDPGGSFAPPLSQVPEGSAVTISEGLEDGLTGVLADPARRVLVAVSLANMGAMKLPDAIGTVTLLQQNDPPGSDAGKAFTRAVGRFQRQGRRVLLAPPPAQFKDINDALRGRETA